MDDQRRARELPGDLSWKLATLKPGSCGVVSLRREEWDYVVAALRAAPEVGCLLALLEQWEQRSAKALPADAMLINKHIRELGSVLRGEKLLNQHGIAVVPNCLEVVPPPTLRAYEVHPETVDAGLDLSKAGERCVAADALEHASGVRDDCDRSATALEVIRIPAGEGLDPITVYADDLGEGRGRLTVCCYSDSWSYTAGWGAMGGSLHSFIADLNPHYLADNLLWPNAAKARKDQRQYVERIAAAVITAFAARPQGVK